MNSFLFRAALAAALAPSLPVLAADGTEKAFRSAFERVARHTDPEPVDWRAANERVAELGGHAGHLRASSGQTGTGKSTEARPSAGAEARPHGHPDGKAR